MTEDKKKPSDSLELKRFYLGILMWGVMAAIEVFVKPIPWAFYVFSVLVLGADISKVNEVIKGVKSKADR